jgi:hypothetical protein
MLDLPERQAQIQTAIVDREDRLLRALLCVL